MEIREVLTERRRYMELLLMGDEQEDMIERYLVRGEMFALHEGRAAAWKWEREKFPARLPFTGTAASRNAAA